MTSVSNLLPRALRLAGLSIAAVALSVAASSAACQRGTPPRSAAASTPDPRADASKPAAKAIAIDGHERLQWEQAGPSLDQVKSYRYMAVVGRRPSDLTGVTCAAKPSGGAFLCSSDLPPMTPGVHLVWVIAVARDGTRVLVSHWAPPLTLQKR